MVGSRPSPCFQEKLRGSELKAAVCPKPMGTSLQGAIGRVDNAWEDSVCMRAQPWGIQVNRLGLVPGASEASGDDPEGFGR